MKRILFIILMFTLINVTNAEECTDNKMQELKQHAENITISTEFYGENVYLEEYTTNIITIQGLPEGFYLYSPDRRYRFDKDDMLNGVIEEIITSDVKKLYVYNNICPNKVIKEIPLSLKTFNRYSEYEECKGISEDELEVCGKFYDKSLTEKEFFEIIEKYKKEKEQKEDINNTAKYIMIGVGVLAVIIVIVRIIRKRKKNILD